MSQVMYISAIRRIEGFSPSRCQYLHDSLPFRSSSALMAAAGGVLAGSMHFFWWSGEQSVTLVLQVQG